MLTEKQSTEIQFDTLKNEGVINSKRIKFWCKLQYTLQLLTELSTIIRSTESFQQDGFTSNDRIMDIE